MEPEHVQRLQAAFEQLRNAFERFPHVLEAALRSVRALGEFFEMIEPEPMDPDTVEIRPRRDVIVHAGEHIVPAGTLAAALAATSTRYATDSGPFDYKPKLCWSCDRKEVPQDPDHIGACDDCLETLRGKSK